MSREIDLPWPQCLGTFDEESCRYFLHEIGSRVVPNYPFSFGMEEVYGLILDKYGHRNTPDVTSLLQELLEDDQCAAGLGDDGDVWRSWRHGWRHRNDDALNPFIPRFGRLVLLPSTAPRIRILKAGNFVEKCKTERANIVASSTSCVRRKAGSCGDTDRFVVCCPMDGSDYATMLPTISLDPLFRNDKLPWRHRLRSLTNSEKSGTRRHVRRFSATDIEPTLPVLFEESEPDKSCSAQLRGGERTCKDISGSPSELESSRKHVGDSGPTAEVVVAQDVEVAVSHDNVREKITSKSNTNEVSPTRSRSDDTFQGIVVQATESPDLGDQQARLTPNHKRRALNRQARLIDGTIFTNKTRKSKTVNQTEVAVPYIPDASDRKSTGRLSWSPIRHRDSNHGNWAREFGRLLHRKKSKQSTTGPKHQSVSALQRSNTTSQFARMSTAVDSSLQNSSRQAQRPKNRNFGLDGASDPSPMCKSSVDLNKPLPLNPDEIVRSMSSRSPITLFRNSDNNSNFPSAASTASSMSRSSSKKESRDVTCDPVHPDMLGPHSLPPIHEVEINHRDLIEPQKTPARPASRISYSSIAQGNPFTDEKAWSLVKPPPLDFSRLQSENKIAAHTPPLADISTNIGASVSKAKHVEGFFSSAPWSKSDLKEKGDLSNSERGRKLPAPKSPTAQSNAENLPPKTPTKRSRSPIKRFLGLTKSNSTNKLDDPDTPVRPVTPGSTTKDSLKKWGERIRYGFLPLDQEQLRQEELIETHHNESTASTPQKLTFPISLEPPVQAKIQSEIELIVAVTANRYLLRESRAGRISAESVARTKELWEKLNRPQVVEFHYDQLTQHNIVMANLDRVKLYGDASKDAIAINSTMRGWKIMAREMSVRTFCCPDSVIRKHLHDAHRVLELLGAPLVTFLAYEDMQLKTLSKITQRQKERVDRRTGSAGRNASTSSNSIIDYQHRRNASEGSYRYGHDYSDYPITALQMDKISLSPSPTPISIPKNKVRKATGAEGAIMSLPTNLERSREGYASKLRTAKTELTMKEI